MTPEKTKPTPLFMGYVVQLVARLALLVAGVWLLVHDPAQLDVTQKFGLAGGLSFVNLVFVLMAADLASKLRPHAKIAMGSRKQYGEFHVPTGRMFAGGLRERAERARHLLEQAPALLEETPARLQQAVASARQVAHETARGAYETGRQLAYTIDVLRLLPWPEEDLTASEKMRESIRVGRMREIVPVIVFWLVFNVALGLLLDRFDALNPATALVWTLFYFVFDMICVVLWCPLQLVLMRNRCCTTCQIFNWDGIMTVTPLFTVWCPFGWLLIAGALVVLVRWELAFVRYPERFDERTNASLSCANCADKLCYLRKPYLRQR